MCIRDRGDVTSISNAQGQIVQAIDYVSFGTPTIISSPTMPSNVTGTLTAPSGSKVSSSASVSWSTPSDDGWSPVVSYVATALPDGRTCGSGVSPTLCGGGVCITTATAQRR